MPELAIERLGHLGDGIAPGPVFVPRVLPGETVAGEVEGDRMPSPRIVTPSPDRVSAPCRHYRACGGCALQHARDAFVAGWKQGVIRAALAAQGIEAPIRPIHTSPPSSRRRATLAGRRLKKGALVGFHGRGSGTISEIDGCLLLDPRLMAALPALREITAVAASRKGEVALQVTASAAGVDLAVIGALEIDRDRLERVIEIAGQYDLARLAWNGEILATRRPPAQTFGAVDVVPPPGAFLQATADGEAVLRGAVAESVGPARRVIDLFAGAGTFALPLARAAEVHAVEADREMLAALDHAWRHGSGLRAVTTEARDLFRNPVDAEDLGRFDAAVIDPPRAGAEAQTRALAESSIARVAAVSCNPVTFARDARILTGAGFRLEWVQPVDQFRWSPHVELAASFRRDHMAGN